LNSQYSGLYGLAQSIDVIATATPIGQPQNVPATVHESLQLASIPLFQFAIFYNVNLEIAPGAPMIISGPVFCNQSIWEGANNATFSSTVTAVGTNCSLKLNPFASNYGPQTPPAVFSMAGQPVDHANALVMPIGTNNNPATILGLLNLPPPAYAMGTAAAYSSNGMVYPANGADLVISNASFGVNNANPSGTNTIIYFQDTGLAPIPFDFYKLKQSAVTGKYTNYVSPYLYDTNRCYTNVQYAGYSFVTNVVFGDWREGWNNGSGPAKTVQAVQIDIGLLNKWLTNTIVPGSASGAALDATKVLHSGHHICSVYVYNYVPLTTTTLPAVRVFNGKQLPDPGTTPPKRAGLTVATPFPMYVQGDYNSQDSSGSALGLANTLHTLPAALMADSITILSDSWNDSITTKLPTPTSTTVNAAMLEGIVASNPNISGNYSGGVENFLRLLENWNNSTTTLTYNGSIVVLFYSQYATNTWLQTANYYNPPKRNWAFDMNFMQSAKLPPLTPSIKAMIRGQWTPQ
jgi:hypothetical protein